MSASTVNNLLHPFYNIIVFPAILQAPFFWLEAINSENFGGIGAVIATKFLMPSIITVRCLAKTITTNNWWTKEDNEHFHELAENMVKEFDDLPIHGQEVKIDKADRF